MVPPLQAAAPSRMQTMCPFEAIELVALWI
jgi:hypothetical protein